MHSSLHSDGDGCKLSFDGEISVLWPEVIVYDGPRGDGPTVIDLPDQCPGAVFSPRALPLPSPEPVSAGVALCLHQLRAVNELLEGFERIPHILDEV